jgi:hypothetical protein
MVLNLQDLRLHPESSGGFHDLYLSLCPERHHSMVLEELVVFLYCLYRVPVGVPVVEEASEIIVSRANVRDQGKGLVLVALGCEDFNDARVQ